jgi:poly(A) polymerase
MPEMLMMKGVTQNAWHLYDVWDHTLLAMRHLPENASLAVRMALLLHDVGKPATRSEDDRGIHFYEHQSVGAEMAYEMLRRLKYPNEFIREVCDLVQLHMRLGEYRPEWSDSAVKRIIRAVHPHSEMLFLIGECDISAMNPEAPVTNMTALKTRMDDLEKQQNISSIQSPLDGMEIMDYLGISPGVTIREAKEYLISEILEGRLPDGDKEAARNMLIQWWTTVKGMSTDKMQ